MSDLFSVLLVAAGSEKSQRQMLFWFKKGKGEGRKKNRAYHSPVVIFFQS
jgi:hypothetical protein